MTHDHQLTPYEGRLCSGCGVTIAAAVSRIAHVFWMHVERCRTATQEERQRYLRTRRWPPRPRLPEAWKPPQYLCECGHSTLTDHGKDGTEPCSWCGCKAARPVCVCNSVAHDDYHEVDCQAAPRPFDSIDMSTGRVS